MSTTEVVIEQVITGFLVLAILALPFSEPYLAKTLLGGETAGLTLMGVAIAGIAYCIGVPADRFADSIMEGLEQRARLTFAWRVRGTRTGDPFPEAALRARMLQHGSPEVVAHMQYLRTRMRISRALAVYVPALAVAGTLRLEGAPTATSIRTLLSLAIAYIGLALIVSRNLLVPEVRDRRDEKPRKLLNTRQLRPFIEAACDDEPTPRPVERATAARFDVAPWFAAAAFVVFLLRALPRPWTLPSTAILEDPLHGPMIAILLGGALLTAVSGWSWWRTTATFDRFLHDFDREVGYEPAARQHS